MNLGKYMLEDQWLKKMIQTKYLWYSSAFSTTFTLSKRDAADSSAFSSEGIVCHQAQRNHLLISSLTKHHWRCNKICNLIMIIFMTDSQDTKKLTYQTG